MRQTGIQILVGGLTLALFTTSCGKQQEVEETIRPVRFEKIYATGGSRVRTFSGTLRAGVESKLSFKVTGTVQRVAVNVGDSVGKGQLLVQLDDSDYRLRVQEAEAALAQAEAQERNARSSYERVQALYENRNASKRDLDAARAARESATAQVESAGKRLELTRLQVSYTRLKAPFDGSVAEVHVDVNENVGPGAPIVTLTAGGRPEVVVSVPEMLIAHVEPGGPASVTCDALPGKTMDGTVTEVGVTSTGFATTFPVTVRLNDDVEGIRPGMAAEASFRFESAGTQERMIVPAVAVGEDRSGRFVFIIEPSGEEGLGVAKRRAVTVGELTPEGLEILEGVEEDELVITAGVSRIVDGQKVRLL
jgi:RND family efflux transporter MFP subunit